MEEECVIRLVKYQLSLVLIIGMGVSFAPSVFAGPITPQFKKADSNGDGVIDRREHTYAFPDAAFHTEALY